MTTPRTRTWYLPSIGLAMWITLIVTLALTSACTTFTTQVGPRVAQAVTRYCAEPKSERMLLREQVKTLAAPNSIQVNCAVDDSTPAPQ